MKCFNFFTILMLLLPLVSSGKLKITNSSTVETTDGQNGISTCGGYVTNYTSIKYPAYGYYRNYEDCTWVLNVRGNYALRFKKMDLENCCSCDWVSVDVLNGTNVTKYCDNRIPPPAIHFLHGRHELKFHSDYSNTNTGFEVSIEPESPTSEFAIGTKGTDICPTGYRHVKDRHTCSTRAPEMLNIPYDGEGCFYDVRSFGCYVGNYGNGLYFKNCDDRDSTDWPNAPVCQKVCGGIVRSGWITYPVAGYYENYENCTWFLETGYYTLRFHRLDLEDCGGPCGCDWVKVIWGFYDGTIQNRTYCGHSTPMDLQLNGPARVEFHSDYSNVGRGFQISIHREPSPTTPRPTDRPAPIDSDHVRRLHGMSYKMERLSSNVAKILQILKNIPSTFGVGEVLKDVRQITSIKKILTGAVIRFPAPVYGDDNAVRYFVQGHVEILHENTWGTICDDSFDAGPTFGDHNANVLCKMGGYKSGNYTGGRYKQRHVKKAPKIWLDEVYCNSGEESSIGACHMRRPWGRHNCNHNEDVGIRCFI